MKVKGAMIRDLLNLAGYMLPDKDDMLANRPTSTDARCGAQYCAVSSYSQRAADKQMMRPQPPA